MDGSNTSGAWAMKAPLATFQPRTLLKGDHVMLIGDLAARLSWTGSHFLLLLVPSPDEVATGFPIVSCWNPDSMRRWAYSLAEPIRARCKTSLAEAPAGLQEYGGRGAAGAETCCCGRSGCFTAALEVGATESDDTR